MESIWRGKLEVLFYLGVVVLLYGLQFMDWNGAYLDSDNYFHALRLMQFFENPSFFEQPFMYTNAPFGEILHWTRALDIFFSLFSLPFLAFYPLKMAIFYGGLLVSPFFGVMSVFPLLFAGRLFLRWKYRLLTAVLILVQVNVIRVIFFNRPDHHGAFFFLSALMLWQMLEAVLNNKKRSLDWAGVIAAFSLWMAAEGVFLAVGAIGFLLYGYLFMGYSYKKVERFSLIYALGVMVFLLVNPPYEGILHIDTGRISAFYVYVAWVWWALLYLGEKIELKWRRICVIGGAVVLLTGIMWGLGWLNSPLDTRIIPLFIDRISEMSAGNVYTLAYPFFGFLTGCFLFIKLKENGAYIYLFLSVILYGGLTIFSFRFLSYAGMYSVFMLALFVQEKLKTRWAKVVVAISFCLLEYVSFIIHVLASDMKQPPVLELPLVEISRLDKGTVATDLFFAPEFIWTGGHRVIASPYHRNVEGILDNHAIFYETDEAKVAQVIRKHHVDYIFLLKELSTDIYYQEPENNCDKLYGQIMACGNVPSWLEKIPVSSGYLYKVNYDTLP